MSPESHSAGSRPQRFAAPGLLCWQLAWLLFHFRADIFPQLETSSGQTAGYYASLAVLLALSAVFWVAFIRATCRTKSHG